MTKKKIKKITWSSEIRENVSEEEYNRARAKYIGNYKILDEISPYIPGTFFRPTQFSKSEWRKHPDLGESEWNKKYPNGYKDWANEQLEDSKLTGHGVLQLEKTLNQIIDIINSNPKQK